MIIESISGVAVYIITRIVLLFPVVNTVTYDKFSTVMTSFRSTLSAMNWILPVDTLFEFLGIILVLEGSLFTFRFVAWVTSFTTGGIVKL